MDINPAFENMFGLSCLAVKGNSLTGILPQSSINQFDWSNLYHLVQITGEKQEVTQYFETLERWYKITALSTSKNHFVTTFLDVTSEMLLIQSLERQNEEIQRLSNEMKIIFDSTPDALFLVGYKDGEFKYIRTNEAYQRLTGYTLSEVTDRTPTEFFGSEIGKKKVENYSKCIETKHAITYEDKLPYPSGRRNWLTTLSPIFEEGNIKYIVGSKKDVTAQKEMELEKEMLLNRLSSMFHDHTAIMLLIEPLTGRIVDANPSALTFYGYSRDEMFKLYIHDINMLPKEEVERRRQLAMEEQQEYFVFPHRKKNGEIRLVDVYSCPVVHEGKDLLFSILFDVTDREMYKEQLFSEKERLNTTLYSIGDAVITTDTQARITAMNRVAEDITGWKEIEAIGRPFTEVVKLSNEMTGRKVKDPVSDVLKTGNVVGLANHTVLMNREGYNIPIADSAAPIKSKKGETFGVIMVFRDVTREKEQQKEILYLSYHDHLTGLYNRRFMEGEIKRLQKARFTPVTVIMGDVNGLKLTNDVFGPDAGEKLLKKVAQVIKESCRQGDIIARWGGDEFLILLPQTPFKAAEKIIERIKRRCDLNNNKNFQISISFGLATKKFEEENLLQVVKEAEELMYHQKLLEGKSYRSTIISTLLSTLAEKSMETEEHAERLRDYCLEIAKELNLSASAQDELSLLAVLHDIGKIGISESILQKPGALTPEEWEEMKKHSEIGYRIAQNTPELATVAEGILFHHERWDGNGYPRGLKGEQIPLNCRILAVADAYDAMTNDRVYRKGMSPEKAMDEITKNSDIQFDPRVVEIFVRVIERETSMKSLGSA